MQKLFCIFLAILEPRRRSIGDSDSGDLSLPCHVGACLCVARTVYALRAVDSFQLYTLGLSLLHAESYQLVPWSLSSLCRLLALSLIVVI